jgi:predicted RNase H-like HicB family nuclease
MIDLPYSLSIEATDEPDFFTYFSPDLPGFSGVAHSVEGCIYQAKLAMVEHIALLSDTNRPVPAATRSPTITIRNAQPVEKAA